MTSFAYINWTAIGAIAGVVAVILALAGFFIRKKKSKQETEKTTQTISTNGINNTTKNINSGTINARKNVHIGDTINNQ